MTKKERGVFDHVFEQAKSDARHWVSVEEDIKNGTYVAYPLSLEDVQKAGSKANVVYGAMLDLKLKLDDC